MFLTRLALAGLALALGAGASLAGEYERPLDRSRFPAHDEEAYNALPRDIIGRYPRPVATGADDRIPLGAYLPVPPNAFSQVRGYAPGEAYVPDVVRVSRRRHHRGHGYADAKGNAAYDRRPTAWHGERGGRRAMVEPAGALPPVDFAE